MAINAIVDSLEGVPEGLVNEYVEREDGKFELKVEGMDLEENWAGLKTTFGNIKNEKKALEQITKSYKQLGSVDELQSILSEYETLKNNPGVADVDKVVAERVESLKQQMAQQNQETIGKLEKSYNELSAKYRDTVMDNAITQAVNATKGYIESLGPIVKSAIDIDDDGKVFVKGKDGVPLVDNKGNNISIETYLEGLKKLDAYKGLFWGNEASGSGVIGNGGIRKSGKIVISRKDPNFASLMVQHAKDMKDGRVELIS